MTKVYDYVVPLSNVSDVAMVIYDYLHGDRSKLRWLIDFAINPADPTIVNLASDLPQLKEDDRSFKKVSKDKNEGPRQLSFTDESEGG
jgi:hypothetical protein